MEYPSAPNPGYPPAYTEQPQPKEASVIPGYPQPQAGYPQPQAGYPQPQAGYPQPQAGYPQPQAGYPQPQAGYPQPHMQPVIAQPESTGQFPMQPMQPQMQIPMDQMVPLNCPPGLEYLAMLDQVLIQQKVELLEAFSGFETNNKYSIKNTMGQKIFSAKETSNCCSRQCFGALRSFEMKLKDNSENEVIHLSRPLACNSCCFPCCLQEMEVFSPPGNFIGSVNQQWSLCSPKFVVKDGAGETVLLIEGPFCTFSMCGDVKFKVLSLDGQKVGKISKQWTGFVREAFTDADMFGINFPMDLDAKIKAVLIGACLLIDFMFFEKSGNKENDGVGML